MFGRLIFWSMTFSLILTRADLLGAEAITVQGAPGDTAYSVGSEAMIRATLRGVSGDPSRFVVFADVSYLGTTAVSSVQLDRQSGGPAAEVRFEGGWLIPNEAPTGIYGVTLRVEDRAARKPIARQKIQGFAAYKKPIRIARTTLDHTFYAAGQPIQCEVVLQNFADQEVKNLRVEFSNAHDAWDSLSSRNGGNAGDPANPERAPKVLRDQLSMPPHTEVTIPMTLAGVATPLQGQPAVLPGGDEPARAEKIPPPEVLTYAVAVWSADRTVLYDLQFTPPAIVRADDRRRPVPYGRNFAHPYNSDIDFTRYRQFYPAAQVAPAITLDRTRTMYRPGDTIRVRAKLKNDDPVEWKDAALTVDFTNSVGETVQTATLASWSRVASAETQTVDTEAWKIPATLAAGTYLLKLIITTPEGHTRATSASEIATNPLPASLMVFNAHEDDEVAYGGLIRAAVEAGIPVRVVFFTGGDAGACERYYSKPCGPNEAREFGIVRMEESGDALAHLGVSRENLTFLGLPDGGSEAIWFEHRQAPKPFGSVYLATDHAPYESVFKPNLPFARDAVIEATKQLIAEFRPAMIATPHPDEGHADRRAANWITVKACQELLREGQIGPNTVVLADVSHGAARSRTAPYRYEKFTVHLSGEAAALKQEMGWFYQSQDGNRAEVTRRNYAELSREEEHLRIVDWQEHEGWNE